MNKKQYDVENHGEERKHKFTMAVWRKITEVRVQNCGQREMSNLIRGQITQFFQVLIRKLNFIVRAMCEKHRKILKKRV